MIVKHIVPSLAIQTTGQAGGNHHSEISLPSPPWGAICRDDRSATAPSPRMVRGAHCWRDDPVLRHADKRRDRG